MHFVMIPTWLAWIIAIVFIAFVCFIGWAWAKIEQHFEKK